jgi:putative DNA primase/helicase
LKNGISKIKNHTKKIVILYESLSAGKNKANSLELPANANILSDVDLVAQLFQGDTKGNFSRLWSGDYSNYTSQSEADMALCSFISRVTNSSEVIDRIFRSSKLMRPKWDLMNGERTYGEFTITKVLENPNTAYVEPAKDRTQYETTLKVVEQVGRENIFSHANQLWLWKQETGVWTNPPDDEVKKLIMKHEHRKNISAGSISSILGILKIIVYSDHTRFSKNSHRRLNFANGELHFEDGDWVLMPHNRDSNFCYQIPVSYDPLASCPRFDQFLEEIFEPDEDKVKKIRLLQEFFGYALTTSCEYERFLLLVGSGGNGKSVILVLLKALLGLKNIAGVQPNQFENKYQLAHLHGKLANIITELPEGAVIADAKIKALVSGEMMTAEHKYGNPFDFEPYSTLIISTNHLPHTKDCSNAFFRRAEILSFNREFKGKDCDTSLKEELPKELQGILNFALKGLNRLYVKGNFTVVPSSKAAKLEWELAADQVKAFIDDQCELNPTARIAIGRLFDEYRDWAVESGIKSTVNRHTLTSRLKRMGCMPGRGSGGVRMLTGVKLKTA